MNFFIILILKGVSHNGVETVFVIQNTARQKTNEMQTNCVIFGNDLNF